MVSTNPGQSQSHPSHEDLLAVEVNPVGERGDLLTAGGLLRLERHGRKLCSVMTNIGHLVGDDQMMLNSTAVCTL